MDPRHLREATRTEHEATEALLPLTDPALTRERYIAALQVLEPLIDSWEQWAAGAAPPSLRDLLPKRRRAHLLRQDLQRLHAAAAQPSPELRVNWAQVTRQAEVSGEKEAAAVFLGALYVIEGSTLGGRWIARHVEQVLHLVPGEGDAYFQGHGEATGAMWREVTAHISEVPEELSDLVIGAARRSFAAFRQVLIEGLVLERQNA